MPVLVLNDVLARDGTPLIGTWETRNAISDSDGVRLYDGDLGIVLQTISVFILRSTSITIIN